MASHSHAEWIYRAYVRYIGAGAVACAGVMTLIKTLPTIVSAFRESVKSLRRRAGGGQDASSGPSGTSRWASCVVGSLVLVLLIAVLPGFPHGPFPGSLLMSLLIVVFGFFFVTVSSRIVGIIGTSSNPISGMTIATLMATCVVFVVIGRTGDVYQAVALCVGAIVCVAAANAGATSQDLKTGYLVGATPRRQQIGFIIGVADLDARDRRHALPARPDLRGWREPHGIGGPKLAGAAGDADGDDHQGPARAEPARGRPSSSASSSRSWRRWPARTPCPGRSAPTCRSRRRSRSGSAA